MAHDPLIRPSIPHKASKMRAAIASMMVTGCPRENAERMERMTAQAAREGARLVCFPEGALPGYYGEHFHGASEIDLGAVASANRRAGEIAREHGVYLVAGTLAAKKELFFNSLWAWAPSGRVAARYYKRHLTRRDLRFYAPGDAPALFRLDGRKAGLMICFDARFPLLAHEYARRGAEILLYAFNVCDARGLWKRPVIEAHLRSRAAEANSFVLGVNDGRPYSNVRARAYDRAGRDIALRRLAVRGAGVLSFADLDFAQKEEPIEREIIAGASLDYSLARTWKK